MKSLIIQFTQLRDDLVGYIQNIPLTKAEEIIFDKWSLKNIIAHLIGWDQHFIEELNHLVNHQVEKSIWVTIQNQNAHSIAKYCGSWDEVVNTYKTISQNLINNLLSLNQNLWNQPLFIEKINRTPINYLKIWIKHINDHLESIKKADFSIQNGI